MARSRQPPEHWLPVRSTPSKAEAAGGPFCVTVPPDVEKSMAKEQAITVAFAVVCLVIAAIWWASSGEAARPHLTFHTAAAAKAPAPPAPATVAVGTGAFGIAAQQNLAGSISGANDRAAAALQSAH